MEDKIAMVEQDLKDLRANNNDKKWTILSQYKEYLEEELKELKQKNG